MISTIIGMAYLMLIVCGAAFGAWLGPRLDYPWVYLALAFFFFSNNSFTYEGINDT